MNAVALDHYLGRAVVRDSQLGALDCSRFVVECLAIGWGRDYTDCLGYHDRRSAVKRLRAAGGLRAAFDDALGAFREAEGLPDGSVVYFNDPAVGIVVNGLALVKYRKTILRYELREAVGGWHTWDS